MPVNPYLPAETSQLSGGTALDAGCGTGAEALWLAEQGWQVTGADVSGGALAVAARRAAVASLSSPVEWLEVDLARWQPDRTWDLVVTSYAHPDIGQLAFYRHIAGWVAQRGTLLIVGHLAGSGGGHAHYHPEGATATEAEITELFAAEEWSIDASYQTTRTVDTGGAALPLRDVIVRAHRIS